MPFLSAVHILLFLSKIAVLCFVCQSISILVRKGAFPIKMSKLKDVSVRETDGPVDLAPYQKPSLFTVARLSNNIAQDNRHYPHFFSIIDFSWETSYSLPFVPPSPCCYMCHKAILRASDTIFFLHSLSVSLSVYLSDDFFPCFQMFSKLPGAGTKSSESQTPTNSTTSNEEGESYAHAHVHTPIFLSVNQPINRCTYMYLTFSSLL